LPTAPPTPSAPEAVPALATGAPRASVSLDVADFPFTYYLQQLQRKVSERWAPPTAIAASQRVVVLFEIGRDGRIAAPMVERSSGSASYDLAALRAVTEASPFPPLPQEFPASSLRVHFGFEISPSPPREQARP
jgi:protein TonB